jgi:hypothetical protein
VLLFGVYYIFKKKKRFFPNMDKYDRKKDYKKETKDESDLEVK